MFRIIASSFLMAGTIAIVDEEVIEVDALVSFIVALKKDMYVVEKTVETLRLLLDDT